MFLSEDNLEVWGLSDFVTKRLFQRTAVIKTVDSYNQLDGNFQQMTRQKNPIYEDAGLPSADSPAG